MAMPYNSNTQESPFTHKKANLHDSLTSIALPLTYCKKKLQNSHSFFPFHMPFRKPFSFIFFV